MPLTVMVVDVQALLQNSKAAKMVRGQIEQKRNEYTKEISHQEETLRAERDALQRQQASISNAMSRGSAKPWRNLMATRSPKSRSKC
jgi:Skp family chaperone for outer membrane proteins